MVFFWLSGTYIVISCILIKKVYTSCLKKMLIKSYRNCISLPIFKLLGVFQWYFQKYIFKSTWCSLIGLRQWSAQFKPKFESHPPHISQTWCPSPFRRPNCERPPYNKKKLHFQKWKREIEISIFNSENVYNPSSKLIFHSFSKSEPILRSSTCQD